MLCLTNEETVLLECVRKAGGEVSMRDILDLSEDAGADREVCRVAVWTLILDKKIFDLTEDMRLVLSHGT